LLELETFLLPFTSAYGGRQNLSTGPLGDHEKPPQGGGPQGTHAAWKMGAHQCSWWYR